MSSTRPQLEHLQTLVRETARAHGISPGLVGERLIDILFFPVNNPKIAPSIIPLVVGLLVIELYFGKYDLAHHDWDDAVANTTMVITSALTLIHDLKLWKTPFQGTSRVAFGILGGGAVILFLNFFHLWPRRIALDISSELTVYITVYLTIALTYGSIPLTFHTAVASVVFFLTATISFKTLKILILFT